MLNDKMSNDKMSNNKIVSHATCGEHITHEGGSQKGLQKLTM
jgi:hypothetical protein